MAMAYAARNISVILAPAFLGLLFLLLCPQPADAAAKRVASKSPVPDDAYLLSADDIQYDEPNAVVIARGNVEITSRDRTLKSGEMQLDNKREIIDVASAVSISEEDGTVFFAREAHLSKNFNDGYATDAALLSPDNTRFAAATARRSEGKYTVYTKGVFSPCDLCKTDPREPPLWQMRAAKTVHDHENKDLIHRDVAMEMGGVPVFYLPYFAHADPTVKRRSGFLAPSFGRNSDIGAFVRVPYYYTFGPDFDYTASPNFNGTDGVRWVGSLRKRFENGTLKVDHSLVVADRLDDDGITKKDQIRGHLNGFVKYNIDNVYRTGADFAVLTDKNYLQRYSESFDDVLTNRVYVEGLKGRNFGAIEGYYFQDNRPSPRPEQPLAMPRARFSAFGEPDYTLGGRWSLDGVLTSLSRDAGADTRKLGAGAGWERRDILPLGVVSTLNAYVRNDVFWVDKLADTLTPGRTFSDDVTNRLFPQGQVKVSYPFGNDYGGFTHTIEPIAALTASPTLKYNPRIPNEDSLDDEFDTTNLFDINRYTGTDQVEQGTRVTYGIKTGFYAHQGSYGEITFGQNYRLTPDAQYPAGSGLDTDRSDYVGQVKFEAMKLSFPSTMRFDYQFRLDKDATAFRRHDVRTTFGVPEFLPSVTYTYLDPPPTNTTGLGAVEELRYGFSTTVEKYYTFRAEQIRDLRPGFDGARTTTLGLSYTDECFVSSISFVRDHTVRTGVKSGDTFFFRIYFKHLGGIDSGPE
jgi:LPS-assembly protein